MVTPRTQIEASDAGVLHVYVGEGVSEREVVVLVQAVIEMRPDRGFELRAPEHVGERRRDERPGIEHDAINDGTIFDRLKGEIESERRTLSERAAEIVLSFVQQKGSLLHGIRISGIPPVGPEIVIQDAMVFVGTGSGEYFDAAESDFIEFRRKRIRVDPHFADRFLRRKLPAAEPVDKDFVSVRSGCGAGDRLEVRLKVAGIVGERLQIRAGHPGGAGVGICGGTYGQPGCVINGERFAGGGDFQ